MPTTAQYELHAAGPDEQRGLQPSAGSGREQALLAAGRSLSWIVLLGTPVVSIVVAVFGLSGTVDLDAMWTALALILVIVFLHAVQCIRSDEARP